MWATTTTQFPRSRIIDAIAIKGIIVQEPVKPNLET
tara:strand:+ start:1424 stop:1531 length:108 start_codon:yes stop_codon:yes gene_type:complete